MFYKLNYINITIDFNRFYKLFVFENKYWFLIVILFSFR